MFIDSCAWNSPLRGWHPVEKLQIAMAGLLISLVNHHSGANLLIFAFYSFMTLYKGRIRCYDYLRLLLVPGFFLAIGVMTVLISYQPTAPCLWKWSLGGISWGVTWLGVSQAELLVSRFLAMVAAMYFLCLSTPVVELTSALRHLHTPEIICDLMYLIYRGIYLLNAEASKVHRAQILRLGYCDWKTSLNSLALLIAAVFNHSLRHSHEATVAMLARGPEGKLPTVPFGQPFSRLRMALLGMLAVGGILLVTKL